ncbi:hypothetical protein ATK30_1794 [Amycolatopsis echigonensis]|uniref:Uncharacterized protein n=1 Tax=Amycolatopsis echigonensis TaxID=2576905 RepID=A0A2N3WAY1_9PSEU|nr:hypothetical protein ATK30_1794 [Amycolatopsis niigatensis]
MAQLQVVCPARLRREKTVARGTPKLDCADGLGVLVKAGKMP